MEQLPFVSVEELEQPQYINFSILAEYEEEHPLRRFYEYIWQYYGGLRADVAAYFCDISNIKQLEEQIEENQEVGLRNEWYRRFVRLLQCNAQAEWYALFCSKEDKPNGYLQYFKNQLVGYAEQGFSVETVKRVFQECNVAYLLEYKIHQTKEEKVMLEKIEETFSEEVNVEKSEEIKERKAEEKTVLESIQQMMQPLLEGQQKMIEIVSLLQLNGKESVKETKTIIPVQEFPPVELIEEESQRTEIEIEEALEKQEQSNVISEVKEKAECQEEFQEKRTSWNIAHLFQQIRLKRKSAQVKKMNKKQQLQEIVMQMQQRDFSVEDMEVVRNLIEFDVTLPFLYAVITTGEEPVSQLRKMYEFLSYQETCVESV